MNFQKHQAFWTAVILHVVVLLGLFIGTIVEAFKPKEKRHVFEMVDPPSETAQAQDTPALPEPPTDIPEVELTPVPQVDISKPRPAPDPPPAPERTREPAPTPPKPKMITAAEFFKENPKPDPRPRAPQPRPQVSAPRIEAPRLVVPRANTATNPSPQLSQQQLSALADYSARLRARIDAAWEKPPQLAGVRLVAEVVFSVSASGRISNVRLDPGSGNTAFDQSVLAAFRRATSAGATPTGQSHEFRLAFRMLD
ncbi:MAG: TonB family protein [Verrucomicrobia bacterium]|jgi:TonB family protein|nr:TonB family protein [Verrucomicrobiota bacterium]